MIAVIAFAGISIETFLIACFSPYQIERLFTLKAGSAGEGDDSAGEVGELMVPMCAFGSKDDMVFTGMFR
jgi:hypothetical protein